MILRNNPRRLWRTASFRLALVFSSIFGLGSVGLLVLLDLVIARFAEAEIRDALRHQMSIMRADANLEGGRALIGILREHVGVGDVSRYRYFVVTPTGERFASGLSADLVTSSGLQSIEVADTETLDGEPINLLVLADHATDGTFIVVGRDTYPLESLRVGLNQIAAWGGLGVILLAIITGLALGMLFLRRLSGINAVIARVVDGDLSERVPPIGLGQEFDDIAGNLNHMLDRLEAAISGLRQVSADLAHDLRTPLTRLRNRLEELMQTVPGSQVDDVHGAIEEADAILAIFDALLRIARVEGGNGTRAFKVLDLTALVRQAVEAYQPSFDLSGHRLVTKLSPDCLILGDSALISQMVVNIVDNALAHTPETATIWIDLSVDNGAAVLVIRDDGPGVPCEDLPHIAKRFYRSDTSRSGKGTGLGLTLVSAIADLHRARLTFADAMPGLSIRIEFTIVDPTSTGADRVAGTQTR